MGKLIKYALTTCILILSGLNLFQLKKSRDLEREILELKEIEKANIEQERDSFRVVKNNLTTEFLKEIDSVLKIKNKVRYYEKHTYIDRNLDSAINILSNYTYKDSVKKNKRISNTRKVNRVVERFK